MGGVLRGGSNAGGCRGRSSRNRIALPRAGGGGEGGGGVVKYRVCCTLKGVSSQGRREGGAREGDGRLPSCCGRSVAPWPRRLPSCLDGMLRPRGMAAPAALTPPPAA